MSSPLLIHTISTRGSQTSNKLPRSLFKGETLECCPGSDKRPPWTRGKVPRILQQMKNGPVTQRTSSSFLGEWWDGLKLNPFAKEDTDEDPEEVGGFFGGWFGSGGKEEKPTEEKEQKQPDKSEQAPQSSGKSWFRSPFGGGSNADKEPKSSSGSSFFGASNNDGASGEGESLDYMSQSQAREILTDNMPLSRRY